MRLKTKLVLAITALVLLISGLLSMVYVSQLLHTAVQQSYDTNKMFAQQMDLALQNALKIGLEGRKVDPKHPEQLRALAAEAIRNDPALKAVLDSVNRYSPTTFDVDITDSVNHVILSTNPDSQDKPLPVRRDYVELLKVNPIRLTREVYGFQPRVYDIAVLLERNGEPFAAVHVGVRTTLLRAVEAPWLEEAITLMGFALGTGILVALLLSNLALRPLGEISMQLDYWSPPTDGTSEQLEEEPRQDLGVRVSHQIERIGQRMRNVEGGFSALKST